MSHDDTAPPEGEESPPKGRGVKTVARAFGSALGFVRQMVPVGASEPVRKKVAKGSPRPKFAKTTARPRKLKRQTGGSFWRRKRDDDREVREARSRTRAPGASMGQGAVMRSLELKRTQLETQVARIDGELTSLYAAIASGAANPALDRQSGASRQNKLGERIARSRQLKEELHELRLELVRAERQITRELQLRLDTHDTGNDDDNPYRPATSPSRVKVRPARKRAMQRALNKASVSDRSQRLILEETARLLDDADPDIRRNAAVRLGEGGAPAAIDLLSVAVEDSSERVRVAALNAVANLGTPEAVALLRRFLHDENVHLRLAALRGVATADVESATAELCAALEDTDSTVRRSAASLMGWRGGVEEITPLLLVLRDDDELVRVAASESLGSLGDDRAVLSLIRTLGDESRAVSEAALRSLRMIVGDSLDAAAGGTVGEERVAMLKDWWRQARVDKLVGPGSVAEPIAREPEIARVAAPKPDPVAAEPAPAEPPAVVAEAPAPAEPPAAVEAAGDDGSSFDGMFGEEPGEEYESAFPEDSDEQPASSEPEQPEAGESDGGGFDSIFGGDDDAEQPQGEADAAAADDADADADAADADADAAAADADADGGFDSMFSGDDEEADDGSPVAEATSNN